MPMEYFGRLGLVFRKSKERGASPCQAAVSKERRSCGAVSPWGDHVRSCDQSPALSKSATNDSGQATPNSGRGSSSKGVVEFWSIASPQVLGAAIVDVKASRDSTPDVLVDIEYLEYEQQVHARARALDMSKFGSSGRRFGWKTLLFWKRRHGPRVLGAGVKPFISSASTPHHHHHQPLRTPRAEKLGGKGVHGNYARRGCATVGPVYCHESPSSMQQFSRRRANWSEEVCNMSPYVALSDRRPQVASPLYFV